MRLDDIDGRIVDATLEKLPATFRTRELSEHPDMIAAHPGHTDRNYHAIVGKYLSRRCRKVRKTGPSHGPEGATWLKVAASTGPAAPPAPVRRSPRAWGDPGPQYEGDDAFTRRMRLHQSWYRARVLKLPYGTGPGPKSTRPYGNMLTPEDGAAGRNFLTPQIFEVVRRRLERPGGAVEPFRLLHNMLSSQPMCFNLFGPLVDDLDLATRVVRTLWDERVERVLRVEIEWAPEPKSAYLNDNTAFDAFIKYRRIGGGLGFLGVETKLTEPFSQRRVDKSTYRRWMTPDGPWHPDAFSRVDAPKHNQLWRDHLLAWAMLRRKDPRYESGCLTVIHHPEDDRCSQVVAGYRKLLRDPSTFRSLTLREVVDGFRTAGAPAEWLDAFQVRYLDLHRSRDASPPPAVHGAQERRPANVVDALFGGGDPHPARGPTVRPVRSGHERCLEQIERTEAYLRTRTMYRQALGGVDVFLRPTDKGFTVLSLDADHCRSMIGVGGRDTHDHIVTRLPPDPGHVQRAVRGYLEKRDTLRRPSVEETYALRLIWRALAGALALPPPDTFFVTQEWRLPSGARIDLLAACPRSRRLLVIELKADAAGARDVSARKGGDAWQQAADYAEEIHQHRRVLYPFFERLARALAKAHDAPQEMCALRLDPEARPMAAVWWPGRETPGR